MPAGSTVAVVCGGRSLERDISLRSGNHVAGALRHLGYDVVTADVDGDLVSRLAQADAAFPALHGRDGEDGTIQHLLEALAVPYTGSDPLTCALAFDKSVGKGVLRRAGIPVPDAHVISEEAVRHMGAGAALREGAGRIGYPIVVKPAAQGSALGLAVVHGPEELPSAVMGAFNFGDRVLLERFVVGRQLAVSLAPSGSGLVALPPVEIRTKGEVFDFQARPTVSPGAAEYLCPADLSSRDAAGVAEMAERSCTALGVRDFARVDLILAADGPSVLDVKTCPGLTETSLLPLAVAEASRTFEQFVGEVIELALSRGSRSRLPTA